MTNLQQLFLAFLADPASFFLAFLAAASSAWAEWWKLDFPHISDAMTMQPLSV